MVEILSCCLYHFLSNDTSFVHFLVFFAKLDLYTMVAYHGNRDRGLADIMFWHLEADSMHVSKAQKVIIN